MSHRWFIQHVLKKTYTVTDSHKTTLIKADYLEWKVYANKNSTYAPATTVLIGPYSSIDVLEEDVKLINDSRRT